MKKILLFFIISYCVQTLTAQDLIYKKDDKIIAGRVLSIDSSEVKFQEISAPNNQTITIPLNGIKEIKFDYNNSKIINKSQSDYVRAKNAVSFGLGGTGGLISVNYDRVVFETPSFFLSAKAGIGSWVSQTNINTHITGNYNFGGTKHYLEFGLGGAVGLGQFKKYYRYYASLPIIGYRLQSKSEKLFFRIYGNAFFLIQDASSSSNIIPSLAIDLGFSF